MYLQTPYPYMAKAHVFNFHELRFSPAQSRGLTQPPSFAPSVLVGIFSAFQGGLARLASFLTQGSHFGGLPHLETTFSAQDGHESLRPWQLGLDLVRSPRHDPDSSSHSISSLCFLFF